MNLQGKTALITGATRGIGRAIALCLAQQGVNIVVTGKTVTPHPKLSGTIYSVAQEIEALGVKALPLPLDIRQVDSIDMVVNKTVQHFGGIDILINNASAINMASHLAITPKKFDLMFGVNVRGTFFSTHACIPHLRKSDNPHILTLAPPLAMQAHWFKAHLAYTMSKYGMSMCTLGLAEALKSDAIAVNALWPKTIIATAAIANLFDPALLSKTRTPDIVAEAAVKILQQDSKTVTGQFFVDEDFLRAQGQTDFAQYAQDPNADLMADLFL